MLLKLRKRERCKKECMLNQALQNVRSNLRDLTAECTRPNYRIWRLELDHRNSNVVPKEVGEIDEREYRTGIDPHTTLWGYSGGAWSSIMCWNSLEKNWRHIINRSHGWMHIWIDGWELYCRGQVLDFWLCLNASSLSLTLFFFIFFFFNLYYVYIYNIIFEY